MHSGAERLKKKPRNTIYNYMASTGSTTSVKPPASDQASTSASNLAGTSTSDPASTSAPNPALTSTSNSISKSSSSSALAKEVDIPTSSDDDENDAPLERIPIRGYTRIYKKKRKSTREKVEEGVENIPPNLPPKQAKLSTTELSSGVNDHDLDQDFQKDKADDTSGVTCPADTDTCTESMGKVSNGDQSSHNQSIASKWKQEKYSRRSRKIRNREKHIHNQPLITNYLQQVDEITKIIQENEQLKARLLEQIPEILPANEGLGTAKDQNASIQSLLTLLQRSAISNKNKGHNNRYEPDLMQFCLYLYIVGGRLMYETLYANLKKSIPSLITIQRHINNSDQVVEASLRFEQLSKFLSERELPMVVWVSEDATGITGRIQYCSKTDSIIGFVSPLGEDGLPKSSCFPANSAQNIQKYFAENERSKYAYVIMAQSPVDKSASFCLSVFGTDNRFTNRDVARRWHTIKEEAKKFGIRILGFSSDGDTRLLKTMRIFSKFLRPAEEQDWQWFDMNLNEGDLCVQDTVHIATKLRTRLLNKLVILQIGDYRASVSDLEDVIQKASKDKHLLTLSDLRPDDKMNFKAAEKMSSQLVENVLTEMVDNSQGTVAFLKLIRFILQAYLNKDETIRTRVYNMWYCVFFLRIWRYWLHENNLSVTKNFVSLNCYLCFELNAHAIIKVIRLYREDPEISERCQFTPWLFSSQPCEHIFRATRSLTSTFSTVVNFSILDIMTRLTKIQQINNAVSDLSEKIIFPREAKHGKLGKTDLKSPADDNEFMSDHVIENCVMDALGDVQRDCRILGLTFSSDKAWQKVSVFNYNPDQYEDAPGDADDNEININICDGVDRGGTAVENRLNDFVADPDDETENIGPPSDIADLRAMELDGFGDCLNMPDASSQRKLDRSFLKVKVGTDIKTIRKSSLCWLLNEQSNKLSSDRLIRVRGNTNVSNIGRKNPTTEEKLVGVIINVEEYYAVYYDEGWYIGRVVEVIHEKNEKKYRVKFLQERFGQFHWPKQNDIQLVEECFIFIGPIEMTGNLPLEIPAVQRNKIITKFKEMKRDRRGNQA